MVHDGSRLGNLQINRLHGTEPRTARRPQEDAGPLARGGKLGGVFSCPVQTVFFRRGVRSPPIEFGMKFDSLPILPKLTF